MKSVLLLCIVLIAFAANSVLSRLGLADGETGAASFAAIRLVSGAVMLAVLASLRSAAWPRIEPRHALSGAMLSVYAIGFSYAYLTLGSGVGALILFGGVQITMFTLAAWRGDTIARASWVGAGVAFAGLATLVWPGRAAAPDLFGAALMLVAAIGWGIYTLLGQGARDPLESTALAFGLSVPVICAVWLVLPDTASRSGTVYAILSGAVTSGLGYALWYRILPTLSAATAAVSQLTVPVIAAGGGALLLHEPLTPRFAAATALVLGGVALTVLAQNRAA